MEEIFIAFLDSLYGRGYGLEFRQACPDAFDGQLKGLIELCGFHKQRKQSRDGSGKDSRHTYLD